jgi:hypothetical protein
MHRYLLDTHIVFYVLKWRPVGAVYIQRQKWKVNSYVL